VKAEHVTKDKVSMAVINYKILLVTILKCAIPVVCMNNRYMGAVNNTTSISNDVYRG